MKLHLDQNDGLYRISSYESDSVVINEKSYSRNMIVMPKRLEEWQASSFDKLSVEDFAVIAELKPELVLLGTASTMRFPPQHLLVPLIEEGIGAEVMDLQAACRTYNILLGEGREVAAALLFS